MFITVSLCPAQDLKSNIKIENTQEIKNADSTQILNKKQTVLTTNAQQEKNQDDTLTKEAEPLTSKIIYNARDSIRYETEGQKIFLFGDAFVKYEEMELKAEFFEIDNQKNTITAFGKKDSLGIETGNPIFNDGNKEVVCGKMVYNLKTKKGKIYNILTKEGNLILKGKEVKKDSNDVSYFKDLSCIPCEQEDSRTIFKTKKAKIIPNDKIVTGPLYLEIGGVPTPLAIPFGFIPNTKKRHSGILIPFYGNSANLGFYLKDGGFYWGISDKTDMTIRGDIYSYGSWGLKTLNNYNVNYKFNGSLALGYSEFNAGEKEIPGTLSKQKDFSISWRHSQDQKNNPNTSFSSNVNIRSSKYNKFNSTTTGDYLTNTFQSNINYTKTFKLASLSLNARHNQNTRTKQMDITFPELTFNLNRFYPFKNENRIIQTPLDKIGISYLFESRNTLSGIDSLIFKGNIGDSLKYGVRHSLPISTNITLFKYFTITPSLNLSSVMYTKVQEKYFDPISDGIKSSTVNKFSTGYDANFNTSLTTQIFMDYFFKSKKIKQIRHLLIPSINYTYRPDYGEKKFGFWKEVMNPNNNSSTKYSIFEKSLFNGPQQGKQNSLGVNLNNNFEAKIRKKTDTGDVYNKIVLLQNLSFSGNYNLAADSFKMSIISASGRSKIWKFFDLNFNATFDPYAYNNETNRRTINFTFNENGKLTRFTHGDISLSSNFESSSLIKKTTTQTDLKTGTEKQTNTPNNEQKQEQLPWNLMIAYNISFDRNFSSKFTKVQTLVFNAGINITKFWKVNVNSGFDFTSNKLSYTSVSIYRDMHCWEARIQWVPIGFNKSYSITINLKSSMFSDIKIPRQRQWYDNL